jgi:hypothetical protein
MSKDEFISLYTLPVWLRLMSGRKNKPCERIIYSWHMTIVYILEYTGFRETKISKLRGAIKRLTLNPKDSDALRALGLIPPLKRRRVITKFVRGPSPRSLRKLAAESQAQTGPTV